MLGLEEPGVTMLPLSSAEQAFTGTDTIERDLRPRPPRKRPLRAVPSAPEVSIVEPAPEPPAARVDLSGVLQAVREEVRMALSEVAHAQPAPEPDQPVVGLVDPPPAAFRVLRDQLGRMERVLVIEAGLNASEVAPASYRVIRDDIGRMVGIEYEA